MLTTTPDTIAPTSLGPMPTGMRMRTIDEGHSKSALLPLVEFVRNVEQWPQHLSHYRSVEMVERNSAGGGIVEMSAYRPFGPLNWPTWWRSLMEVDHQRPAIRFRHIAGITTGMEVDWSFSTSARGTQITLVHEWNGPAWPLIGGVAAQHVIGPLFVHGIAERTLRGLVRAAEERQV